MKAVEVQFMRKFISKQSIETTAEQADPQLMSLLPVIHFDLPCASIASSLAHTEALLNIGSLPISLFKSSAVLFNVSHHFMNEYFHPQQYKNLS